MTENKCDTCKKEFAKCDGKTKVWGIDKNPNATGKEADMVLECDAYEQKTEIKKAKVYVIKKGNKYYAEGNPSWTTKLTGAWFYSKYQRNKFPRDAKRVGGKWVEIYHVEKVPAKRERCKK